MDFSVELPKIQGLELCATAIGSFPYDEPKLALDLIFEQFKDCPLWPQLSKVNRLEDMTTQYLQGLPGLEFDEKRNKYFFNTESEKFCLEVEEFFLDYETIINEKNLDVLEKYAITDEYTSAIPEFLTRVAEFQPPFAKGHVIGPLTLGLSLDGDEGKCAFYDDILRDIIVKGLTLKALWQVEQIKKASPKTTPIIFLDEPAMSQYGTSALLTVKKSDITSALREISDVVKCGNGLSGVHCCGKTDWTIITESDVNILNFDAFFFSQSLSLYAKDVENFMKKGGFVAWGIVPTLDSDALQAATENTIFKLFEQAVEMLCAKGLGKSFVLKHSLITPSCGAGGLSVELAEKAMCLTSELSKKLKSEITTGVK